MSRYDPKPLKRHKADIDEWKIIRRLKSGRCRVCGNLPTTLHHLIGKDLGGDDLPANMVPLCGSGTSGCHGLVEEFDLKACQTLRISLTEQEIGYVVGKASQYWLNRRYPRPGDRWSRTKGSRRDAEDESPNKERTQSVGHSSQRQSES